MNLKYFIVTSLNIIILIIFLFFGSAYSQQRRSITIYGLPQRTFMYSDQIEDYPELQRKPSYNFSFGFAFKYLLSRKYAIGYGIQYSANEQKYHVEITKPYRKEDFGVMLKYMKIPVLLQYNFVVKNKYSLFCFAEPQLNILLAENGGIPVYMPNYFDLVDPGGVYKNFVLAGVAGLGTEISLDDRISVSLQVQLERNLTRVEKKRYREIYSNSYGDNYELFSEAKVLECKANIVAGVALGLSFKIGK